MTTAPSSPAAGREPEGRAPSGDPAARPSRLWLWFVVAFVVQAAAWTAWFVIAKNHRVEEVPLATAR